MDHSGDPVRVGEGVQAEVFIQSDGSVLKLWRSPDDRRAADREASALRALADSVGVAPVLLAVVEADGRPGLVMERVEGGGLAAFLRSRPWSVGTTARALAQCHATIHAISAPTILPALKDDLRERIESTDALPPSLAQFAIEILEGLPDGDRVCHGDFHIANVLGTRDRLVVIDWPNAARGDPDADVAHTNILHRFGRPREGTNRLERVLVNVGQRSFGARYFSAYQMLRPVDEERLRRWETVRAASRLSTKVPGEAQNLLRFLEQRRAASSS